MQLIKHAGNNYTLLEIVKKHIGFPPVVETYNGARVTFNYTKETGVKIFHGSLLMSAKDVEAEMQGHAI